MSGNHRPPWYGVAIADWSRQRVVTVGALAVIVLGVVFALLTGATSERPVALPPTPPSPTTLTTTPAATSAKPAKSATSVPHTEPLAPLKCSEPARSGGGVGPFQICIPTLRVDTAVMSLGLNKDRTVQVPPLSRVQDAGWYRYSAAPGEIGPTVILGHVDSAQYGDGVFFRLGTMRAGDTVVLSRGDGKVATFRVDRVEEVSKRHFPTGEVYGATSGPAIRLVTCGGRFNSATGSYEDNIIAFGTLLSLHSR
ncbi:MAG: class F sortase [Jatrophihabitans sp.]